MRISRFSSILFVRGFNENGSAYYQTFQSFSYLHLFFVDVFFVNNYFLPFFNFPRFNDIFDVYSATKKAARRLLEILRYRLLCFLLVNEEQAKNDNSANGE